MLHRLRLKFILTNMLLVAVVLLAVFSALMISTAQQLERESAAAMSLVLRADGIPPRFEVQLPDLEKEREWRLAIPVFCVTVETDGSLSLEDESRVDVTQEVLSQAVEEVRSAQSRSGSLRDLGLRFLQESLPDGRVRIAFSDLSWERASLTRLMVSSLLIGAAALAVFFAISLFLARLSLKPVERAWAQQRQFVADASHELKTPLTVILANTGIMAAHPDATVASQCKWLGYIQEEAQRMKELVEDMLFLAKHDGAERPKDSRAVNFSDLVTGCVLRFESVAFERQVALTSRIQPDLSVSGEPDSLERLVMILLDNAVKYAGERGPSLRLHSPATTEFRGQYITPPPGAFRPRAGVLLTRSAICRRPLAHQLNGLLAGEVFHRHLQHAKGSPLPVNGLGPVLGAVPGGVLQGQLLNGRPLFPVLLQDAEGAKDNHTAEIGGILLRNNMVLVYHTERGPGVPADGVHLVAALGRVKIQLPLCRVIYIADGDGVGVTSIA